MGLALPNLQFLIMQDNQFQGPIPVSLCNASGLQLLDLANNSFNGLVPSNLGYLKSLRELNIGWNLLHAHDWSFFSSLTNCSLLEGLILHESPTLFSLFPCRLRLSSPPLPFSSPKTPFLRAPSRPWPTVAAAFPFSPSLLLCVLSTSDRLSAPRHRRPSAASFSRSPSLPPSFFSANRGRPPLPFILAAAVEKIGRNPTRRRRSRDIPPSPSFAVTAIRRLRLSSIPSSSSLPAHHRLLPPSSR